MVLHVEGLVAMLDNLRSDSGTHRVEKMDSQKIILTFLSSCAYHGTSSLTYMHTHTTVFFLN